MLGITTVNERGLEALRRDFRNSQVWSNQRLDEEIQRLNNPGDCCMKSSECRHQRLKPESAKLAIVDGREFIGCAFHMEPFAVIEGVDAIDVKSLLGLLVSEKHRREEQAAAIARREAAFRGRIRHSIAILVGVPIELVTDDDVTKRIAAMKPEAITKVHEMLDRQEELRGGGAPAVPNVVSPRHNGGNHGPNGSKRRPQPEPRPKAPGFGGNGIDIRQAAGTH